MFKENHYFGELMATTRYYQIRIRIRGRVPAGLEDWFGGLRLTAEQDDTLLSGPLPDQSALLGVLDAIHNLGLTVLSVSSQERQPVEASDSPQGD